MDHYNLVSLAGLFVVIGLAWLLSRDRRRVNWRLVATGTGLQLTIALVVFLAPGSASAFQLLNDLVVVGLETSAAGTRYVFGSLAMSPPEAAASGFAPLGFILAFQGLPMIIFFSALVGILYHFRIMPAVIRWFARLFARTLRVSGAESVAAASNIFVGVESCLAIRPYLARMTPSELCTVLTAGMATVASNVLVLYVHFLRDVFPAIAGHLLSASLLSAPAAVVMAKILLPETGSPETMNTRVEPAREPTANWFEALIRGAEHGLKVVFGVVTLLIATVGLVALVDRSLGWAGGQMDLWLGLGLGWDWSLSGILGVLFYPLVLVLGVPPADAWTAARLIGERMVVTELVAYQNLAAALAEGQIAHPRSVVIITYALCGFAHFASVAIFVGGAQALAPERTKDLARVGFTALWAATLACLMTACVAGALFTGGPGLLTG